MKICKRCVMNSDIPNISFDDDGICNYCHLHNKIESQYPLDGNQTDRLKVIIDKMKEEGKNKLYDCIIGISGGCDSSFLLHSLKTMGVRPLAITLDNTWGTEIAKNNIQKMVSQLNIDLRTYTLDKEEFDDITKSFLMASVSDADAPSDMAIAKIYYMAMAEYGIKYAIDGHSFRTEGTVPLGWTYMDGMYVISVHEQFGIVPMKTFPNLDIDYWLDRIRNHKEQRIRMIYYFDYHKDVAKKLLTDLYGWEWYGGHHFENHYTRFLKTYLLPRKFGIDKRYVEFSALVRSGQKDRLQALEELKTPPEVPKDLISMVKNRLGFNNKEWLAMMNSPIKSYKDYTTYRSYFIENREMFKEMLNQGLISETFYEKYTK